MVAVVTGEDAPNRYGILPVGHDETALAVEKVRYIGDNVACVAAISEEIAERAIELIDVEYEPLPAYFDPEESMKAETDLIHEHRPHNLEKDYHHVFGDPEQGFAEADYVHEARYIANEVNARRDGAAQHAGQLRTRSPHRQARTADGMVVHAGSVLPAAQAVAGAGDADVADPRHQAAGRRRIRRQERDHPTGDHRGGRGARGAVSGQDHVHARGSFLGASRPSAHHHRSEDWREE